MLSGVTAGEPAWLAAISQHGAALLAHQGLAASVGLAALLALIAVGVYLPPSAARAVLAVAAVLAAVIGVAGQDLGGILTGSGTDPESGPLLILLVLAYWPVRTDGLHADEPRSHPRTGRREVRDVTGPSWLAGILAAVMIATAGYCASRLIIARAQRRRDERDVNLVHTVMGVAMAGMLVSWLNPLPDGVWAVMFGAATGWFGWRAWRGRQHRADARPQRPVAAPASRAPPRDVRRHGVHAPRRRRGDLGHASRDGHGRPGCGRPLPAARPGPGRVHGGLRDVAGRPPPRPGPGQHPPHSPGQDPCAGPSYPRAAARPPQAHEAAPDPPPTSGVGACCPGVRWAGTTCRR